MFIILERGLLDHVFNCNMQFSSFGYYGAKRVGFRLQIRLVCCLNALHGDYDERRRILGTVNYLWEEGAGYFYFRGRQK